MSSLPYCFDLTEGLEYLKNSWEWDNQEYKANELVKNIPLRIGLEEIHPMIYMRRDRGVSWKLMTMAKMG